MKFPHLRSLRITALGVALLAALAAGQAQTLDLVTPGFSMKFIPKRAWTYGQIDYRGETISGPTGFHGLVVATGPALFLGSGHNEGGVEEVESVEVVVDGKPLTDPKGVVECQEAVVTKRSRIGDFTHEAIVKLTAERIDLDYRLKAVKNTYVEILYPFMFCWSPTTTEWLAELKGGGTLDGTFKSDGGWELEKDTAWTAVYMPEKKIAAVVKFAGDLPPGTLHKHGFWDREQYHKLYYQSLWKAVVSADQSYRYQASVFAAEVTPEDWKATVEKLVTQGKE